MAIKSRGISRDGKRVMTVEEFKQWLLNKFDANKDGRISQQELQNIIHFTGQHLASWKSKRIIRSVDSNGDGFVDQSEITGLIEFANKHFDIKVVHF